MFRLICAILVEVEQIERRPDDLDSPSDPLWLEYVSNLDDPDRARARCLGKFSIGHSSESADQGARLVLTGRKTATSSLPEEHVAPQMAPFVGALSLLQDGRGDVVAIVETTEVAVTPFEEVDSAFAYEYGEWDRTLGTWREKNGEYYERICRRLGIASHPRVPLLCERLFVVYPRKTFGRRVAFAERLELRQFSPDDAEHMFALNNDPEAIRYTGDVAFSSVEAARQFLLGYDGYEENAFGRWSVYLRDSETYLGFCGLGKRSSDDRVDLGFRIAPLHWGRGYATEAGRAALELGFERYGLDRIVARAMPQNTASHRVLEKLGFSRTGRVRDEDGQWLVYEVSSH